MTAEDQHVSIYKGDNHKIVIHVVDMNNEGVPLNLSDSVAEWSVYRTQNLLEVYTKTGTSEGVSITDALNGVVEIFITEADTLDLTPGGTYTHKLKIISDNGDKSTVTTGALRIKM